MQLLLDVKEEEMNDLLALLKNISSVKFRALTPGKALFLTELSEAVTIMNEVKRGEQKSRPLKSLLDEL